MADFDPNLHTSQDFNPSLYTPAAPEQPRGMVRAFGAGMGQEATGVFGKGLALAASTPFMLADAAHGMVTGQSETGAQDWAFKNLVDPMSRMAESFAPTAAEQQSIPLSVARGLGGMAADLPVIAATGGLGALPEGAGMAARAVHGITSMAPVAVGHGVEQAGAAMEQGVDTPTALASGVVSGITTAASGAVPLALAGNILKRAATGAISGMATGEVGRQAQNAVLDGHPESQTNFTPQGLAVNAATGALLGSILGPRPEKAAQAKALSDAQADLNDQAAGKPLAIGYNPEPMIGFPDGSAGTQKDADAYIASLPADQQMAARAKLYNIPTDEPLVTDKNATQMLADAANQENATPPEPVIAQTQQHAQDIAKLRDAGETPTGNPVADRAAVFDLFEKAPETPEPPPEAPVKSEQQKAEEDIAYAQNEARKEQDAAQSAILAKVNAGEPVPSAMQAALEKAKAARADADARAQVVQDAKDAAVKRITDQVPDAVKGAYSDTDKQPQPGLFTKIANEVKTALTGKDTPAEQLAALKTLSDKATGLRKEIFGTIHDKLTEEGNAKAAHTKAPETQQTETQGSGERPAEPANAAPAVAPAAAPEIVTKPAEAAPALAVPPKENPVDDVLKPTPAEDALQAAADRVTEARATLTAKAKVGTGLTDAESANHDDLVAMQHKIADVQHRADIMAGNQYSPEQVKAITADAHDLADGKKLSRSIIDPETPSPKLAAVIAASPDVNTTLGHLAENGSAPWIKELAAKLQGFGLKTTIDGGPLGDGFRKGAVGGYNTATDHIAVPAANASEATVLHEALHAATFGPIEQARTSLPRNQAEATRKTGYNDLEAVRLEAIKKSPSDYQKAVDKGLYGLTDIHEFMAELNANPVFRDFLAKKSLWERTVEGLRKLLGLPVDTRTLLDKALSAQNALFDKGAYDAAREFNASPQGAAKVTDMTLARLADKVDEIGEHVNLGAIDRTVFKYMAGWKTVQYLADRVRALPDMVAAGLDKGVDGYLAAHGQMRMAAERAGLAPAKFTQDVGKMLHGMKDDAARESNHAMAEIGTGSSIGGFDPTKNFDDNKAIRGDLDPSNKGYIDGIYRKFTQLKATNPAAAQHIIDGAKVNRANYIATNATIIRNLINNPRNKDVSMLSHAAGLDFMAKDLQAARNGDTVKFLDGASYTLDQRIQAAFAAAAKLPEGSRLRDQLAEWQGLYQNTIDNPYYSAGRQGDHFVHIGWKDMDDATWAKMQAALVGTNKVLGNYNKQNQAFFKVDTIDQARGMRAKLEAAMGDKADISQSASGELADNTNLASRAGISEALRSVLASLHETVDDNPGLQGPQADLMKEAMTRQFLSMLPETSTKLATLKRMGVPGYDGDFLGSFARRASGAVQDTAHIYAAPLFSHALQSMNDAMGRLNAGTNIEMQSKARTVVDEINLRHANSLQPVDNTAVNQINSLGHTFYLAAAPAFYIRTMAQPWHRAMPILGSRYGFVNSAKELASATPTALRIIKASLAQGWADDGLRGVSNAGMKFTDMGLSAKDQAFVQELHDRGVLKLGNAQQLQKMALGGNQKVADFTKVVSLTAQYAEMTNRLITGLAAFRLAEKGKEGLANKGTAANTEYAIRAIDLAMDNFDSANTARQIGKHGIAGKVTPLMTQFMNYNMQTMQQIARTVHDGFFNRDQSVEGKQRSLEAKKELGGLFATTAMISGAMGLPFVNAFAGVYNSLMSDTDNPTDIREGARNGLASIFGPALGNVASHGIGAAVGVDTSTFGLENLLPGSEFLASRRQIGDKLADQSTALMGPAINGGVDIAKALVQIHEGLYLKGIENALPSGLKGYYKAWELADKGNYTDSKGNDIGMKATPWDVAIQATGLRPSDKATQAEAQRYSIEDTELRQHRAGLIRDQYLKAGNDPAARAEAGEAMRAFNQKNPLAPITGQDIASTLRTHARAVATGLSSGTGVGATSGRQLALQNQRLQFAKNAAYAAMPIN